MRSLSLYMLLFCLMPTFEVYGKPFLWSPAANHYYVNATVKATSKDSRFRSREVNTTEQTERLVRELYHALSDEITRLPLRPVLTPHHPNFNALAQKLGYQTAKFFDSLAGKMETPSKIQISKFKTPFMRISAFAPLQAPELEIEVGGEAFISGMLNRVFNQVSPEISSLKLSPQGSINLDICKSADFEKTWRSHKAETLYRLSGVIDYFEKARLFVETPKNLSSYIYEELTELRDSLRERYELVKTLQFNQPSVAYTQCYLAEQSVKKFITKLVKMGKVGRPY